MEVVENELLYVSREVMGHGPSLNQKEDCMHQGNQIIYAIFKSMVITVGSGKIAAIPNAV
jgi:hypothetical protein